MLIVDKEEISVTCSCGIRKGSNLAPTLFIIVTQLVAKNVSNKLIKAKIQLPSKCSANREGAMRLHNKDHIEDLVDRNVCILMCANDKGNIFIPGKTQRKAA